MKRRELISAFYLALALLIEPVATARAAERIHNFHSDIQVLKDGSLKVTETITVSADGDKIKRGIYRDFPVAYTSRFLTPIKLPFHVVSVKRDGKAESFHMEDQSNGLRVYIGRQNYHLPQGKYTYKITYTTNFQLGYFDTHDELYWNVTGNGWVFPIDRTSASVSLPEDVPRDKITHEGYTGPQGSQAENLTSTVTKATGNVDFVTTNPLRPREGMTIVVGFPKGLVHEPTATEKRVLYFQADRILWTVLGGLLVVLTYYIFAWVAVGRDPSGGTIYPLLEPPLGLPPACMRYLRCRTYDKKCFTAALINMAVKRHLEIDEKEGQFTLRLAESSGKERLSPGEITISKVLLGSTSIVLQQSNHKKIGKAIEKLGDWLSEEYERKLFFKNRWWLVPGWLLSALSVTTTILSVEDVELLMMGFFILWLSFWTPACAAMAKSLIAVWKNALALRKNTARQIGSFSSAIFLTAFVIPFFIGEIVVLGIMAFMVSLWMVPLFIGLVAINWSFWHWMTQPTVEGQRVMDQIEGFRMYLATAEGDFLQKLHAPELTTELFEKYLPYALALDVENAWAEKFSNVLERAVTVPGGSNGYHPAWYHGTDHNQASMGDFASHLGHSIGSAVSSSSTAPGSSSGGSGGGSSGGGGGGGGGGGW